MSDIADLGTLCRALGFLAVAMKEDNLKAGSGVKAEKLAHLIEEFCHISENEIESTYTTAPIKTGGLWSCEHAEGKSVIRTPNNFGGGHMGANVIELHGSNEATTRAAAEQIVHAVNDNSRKDALIAEMTACLEMCMESRALNWDAEHDADILVGRAKSIAGV